MSEAATITFNTDRETEEAFTELCVSFGMDVTTALNVFMKQSIHEGRIPFRIGLTDDEVINYRDLSRRTKRAIKEAETLITDPSTPRYSSAEELFAALNIDS